MSMIRNAVLGLAALAAAVAAPSVASAQSDDVKAELALAHGFLDADIDAVMRSQFPSFAIVAGRDVGFTAAEYAALDAAFLRELEVTIKQTQDLLAQAASDAFTVEELRAPMLIPPARWDAVTATLQDRLVAIGAELGARAILGGCGAVVAQSPACKDFTVVAHDYLAGRIPLDELRAAAGQ